MKSKIFAALLAVMMVVSILPVGVFAAGTGTITGNGTTYTSLADACANGGVITIDGTISTSAAITITKDVTIKGSVNGGTISNAINDVFTVEMSRKVQSKNPQKRW